MVALVSVLGGCALLRLGRDVRILDGVARIEGRVDVEPGSGPAIVVLLEEPGGGLRDYQVLPRAGAFELLVDAGRYRVAAFLDEDGDLALGPAEPAALSPVIAVAAGERIAGIDLAPAPGGGATLPRVDLSQPASSARLRPWKHRLGEVVSLDDERFSRANGQRGLWQPVEFLIAPGPGLYLLEPYDPDRVPVIFVHGVGGSPRDVAPLVDRIDRARFQPWVFHYASALRIELSAALLHSAVTDLWARHRFDRLAVVAHSMGGLVARAALERVVESGGAAAVGLFFTVSTPWQGHEAAERGAARSPVVMPVWIDLAPGSEFLRRIGSRPLPPAIPHVMLFSFAGQSRFVTGASDGVVSLTSLLDVELQRAARRVIGLPEDHVGILSSPVTGVLLHEALDEAFPE